MAIQGLPGAGLMFPQGPVPLGGAQDTGAVKGDPALPGVGPAGEALLHNRPLARQQLAENPEARARFARATGGAGPTGAGDIQNAIELLAGLLERYGQERMQRADYLAHKNQRLSRGVANASICWAREKAKLLPRANAEEPWEPEAEIGHIRQGTNAWKLRTTLYEDLGCEGIGKPDPHGSTDGQYVDYIFGSHTVDNGKWFVSYDQIRAAGGVVTGICDASQVEVDKGNQDFKNCMTLLNSSRDELKDLRRELLSLGKR